MPPSPPPPQHKPIITICKYHRLCPGLITLLTPGLCFPWHVPPSSLCPINQMAPPPLSSFLSFCFLSNPSSSSSSSSHRHTSIIGIRTPSAVRASRPKEAKVRGQSVEAPDISASSQQQLHLQKQTLAMHMACASTVSTPSPSATHSSHPPTNPQTVSSSDTASSPSHSPIPSLQEVMATTTKPESEARQHHQFRKGKYVSPVWKLNEMLCLARAWQIQYQGGDSRDSTETLSGGDEVGVLSTRGKTRAHKDREVAEFLNLQGVNRDAKTLGTTWDNMLGEFRKVYEWEKGGERE